MFRDKEVLPDWIPFGMVDVARPVGRIGVRTGAQPREQCELKMVVRIDQARQDLKAVEIQLNALDIHVRNTYLRTQRATKRAGSRQASSKRWSWPAHSKNSRSGGPRRGSIKHDN